MTAESDPTTTTGSSAPLPSAAEQLDEIKDLLSNSELEEGDIWYVISKSWCMRWEKLLEHHIGDSNRSATTAAAAATTAGDATEGDVRQLVNEIGPIDNADLFEDGEKEPLKKFITNSQYEVFPKAAWVKLVQWYGVKTYHTAIPRKVISEGFQRLKRVEVVLVSLNFTFKDYPQVSGQFSKYDTIGILKAFACAKFNLTNDNRVQLRSVYDDQVLKDLNDTIHNSLVIDGQTIIVEELDETGNAVGRAVTRSQSSRVPLTSQFGGSSSSSSVLSPYNTRSSTSHGSGDYGLVGLNNLGNTCFMNSGLQCLSNTVELSQYFLDNAYLADINRVNPLGTGGELAAQYGDLIKALWSGGHSSVAPRSFKLKLSMFAPQFSGYQQHDSQELLAFLLDGLHEDLNRIQKKPYIELKDSDGRPDQEVAGEMWRNHLLRNDSIIVDLFQGQFKSTLVCPECSKVSITFDPFMYLSLPLPSEKSKVVNLTFVPSDPQKSSLKVGARVGKSSPVSELRRTVGGLVGVEASNILIVDIYAGKVYNRLDDTDVCGDISDRDEIYAYEVTTILRNHPDYTNVCFVHFDTKYSYQIRSFGYPLIKSLPRNGSTGKELYDLVANTTSRYIRKAPIRESASDAMDTSESSLAREASADENAPPYRFRLIHLSSKCERPYTASVVEPNDEVVQWDSGYFGIDWDSNIEHYFDDDAYKASESVASAVPVKKDNISLQDCLQLFLREERLGEDDPWYCPRCKKHQQASKKFDLWKTPKILVVHLKRFSYTRYYRDKLDVLVDFPLRNLDLTEYVLGNVDNTPVVYDLYAVSNHYGGMGGGHYTAYGFNQPSGRWYNFDDSHVAPASEGEIKSRAAYVLFYRRRDDASVGNSGDGAEPEPMSEDDE